MIQAVICDVYGTLLEVGPAPVDAADRWRELVREFLPGTPDLTRSDFVSACRRAIAARHQLAHAQGMTFPEVIWPEIVAEAAPAFAALPGPRRIEFIDREVRMTRTTGLIPGAAAGLRRFREAGCILGIASNAQDYTLRELAAVLAVEGIGLDWFDRELCFWSFENGFSKPDPHVFRLLTARLALRSVPPGEILMVGDRLDNDIEPARSQGWRTWRIGLEAGERNGGWERLAGEVLPFAASVGAEAP